MLHGRPRAVGKPASRRIGAERACHGAVRSIVWGRSVGVWRSLVARLFWVQEVVGSSPAAPTNEISPEKSAIS